MISFSSEVLTHCPQLDIGSAVLEGIMVSREHPYLDEFKRKTSVEIQSRYSLSELKKAGYIRAFRDLYWSFGMDPTKLRPSAEALARRVLSGDLLPVIDNVVDAINIVSLKHLLPVSCFDRQSLTGPLMVRRATAGESITKIHGVKKGVTEGTLVLSDDDRIVCLGYASMDAYETRITPETKEILVLVYKAPGIEKNDVLTCLSDACDLLMKVAKGTVEMKGSLVRGEEGH